MASSGPSDGDLDKMIEQQRQLLNNIEKLEREAPGKQSMLTRISKSMQKNRLGAAAMLMAATCAVMSLNMLRHKKDFEAKAEEIEQGLKEARAQQERATKDADELKKNILREVRSGGWGMTARIEALCGAGPAASTPQNSQPEVDPENRSVKIQPKMI